MPSADSRVARLRGETPRSLLRKLARRGRRAAAGLRRVTVRPAGMGEVRVSRRPGLGWRSYRLDDPAAGYAIPAGRLRLVLPDAAALVEIAVAGLLTGEIRRLRVRLASAPEWSVTGVRPPRLGRTAQRFRWRRRGVSLTVEFGWSRPYGVHRALGDAIAAVVRARAWDQLSGPVYALDRTAWLDGAASWPQGVLAPGRPDVPPDAQGRPLGPYLTPGRPAGPLPAPVLTALANPYGRRLVGAATRYRLGVADGRLVLSDEAGRAVLAVDRGTSAEPAVAGSGAAKFAVVGVDPPVSADPAAAGVLRALAACGMVFATPDPAVRSALDVLGLVTVRSATDAAGSGLTADLRGYALSVAAARRMAITGDAALRRTALAGNGGTLPLPAVSVVLSSMRSDHIEQCLRYLAAQTYPELEVLVGLHGYEVPEPTRERWATLLPHPVRVSSFPAELTFGAVLGRLSRLAEGELLTKVDDDDHYGAEHVTDLVIAWYASGADLAAKGSRFVHFPDRDETIDRAWAAPELFDVTPAGGTLLLARSTLQELGGWSHSSRHVDTDLLTRLRSAGGLVYRTHGLEYVYVRRNAGHTWVTGNDEIAAQGERVYKGLPPEIIRPDYRPAG